MTEYGIKYAFFSDEIVPLSFFPNAAKGRGERIRPILGGISCGTPQITAGTLGFVIPNDDGIPLIVTNNHVGANEAEDKSGVGNIVLLQPGRHDGGQDPKDRVGVLYDVVPLKKTDNVLDSCAHKVLDGVEYKPYELLGTHKVEGYCRPRVGMQVVKSGRTTNVYASTIIGVNAAVRVRYSNTTRTFVNQIIVVNPFGAGGDSGSTVVVSGTGIYVGRLFAGSPQLTALNPAEPEVKYYNLDLEYKEPPSGGPCPEFPKKYKVELKGKYKLFRFEFPITLEGVIEAVE